MTGRILVAMALLAAAAGCSCNDTTNGAVRLTVQYSGFDPGCVRVRAEDAAAPSRFEEQTLARSESWDGSLVIAVYREKDWGRDVKLTVSAHEMACTGAVVDTDTATVKIVAGEITEHTSQLAAVDVDQDGWVATSSGGTDCADNLNAVHPGATELCNESDDDCDQTVDEDVVFFDTWADGDNDGFGSGTPISECAVSAGRVQQSGDCDDGNGRTFPDAGELCDAADNDCDLASDEGLAVGDACSTGKACPGLRACAADGGIQCDEQPLPWYVDFDRDQRGALDAGSAVACDPPAGYVASAADCDDGDPFTYAAASEICDRKDNDCDGTPDEDNVCAPGDGGWALTQVGGTNNDWKTVAAVDAGWWWMGGRDANLAPNGPDLVDNRDGGLTDRYLTCQPASEWSGSWAYQSAADDSTVLLAGCVPDGGTDCAHGALAMASTKSATCLARRQVLTVTRMKSVVGIREAAGLRVFAVGTGGTAYEAHPTTLTPLSPTTLNAILNDVHGTSVTSIYVAGATSNGAEPRVYRYDESTGPGQWISELGVETLGNTTENGQLLGIWVVHPELVFAVGENGMVLRKVGSTWSALPDVPGGLPVRSVRAFGHNSVYVASGSEAYRWNGTAWEHIYDGNDITRDLDGVRPDQLLIVADDGDVAYSRK